VFVNSSLKNTPPTAKALLWTKCSDDRECFHKYFYRIGVSDTHLLLYHWQNLAISSTVIILQDRQEVCFELERDTTICKSKTKPLLKYFLRSKTKQASALQSTSIKTGAEERGTVLAVCAGNESVTSGYACAALFV